MIYDFMTINLHKTGTQDLLSVQYVGCTAFGPFLNKFKNVSYIIKTNRASLRKSWRVLRTGISGCSEKKQ